MAAKSKRKSKKNTKSAKSNNKVIPINKKAKKQNLNEIYAIGGIALSILLMLGVYGSLFGSGSSGLLSMAVNSFLQGFTGIGAYVIPILIFAICLHTLFKKQIEITTSKVIMSIALFVSGVSFAHILTNKDNVIPASFSDYLSFYYSNGAINNGGLIGAIFGNILTKTIGNTGAFVILVTVAIILLVFLTNSSVVDIADRIYGSIQSAIESRTQAVEYEDDDWYESDDEQYEYEEYDVSSLFKKQASTEFRESNHPNIDARKNKRPITLTIQKRPPDKESSKVLLLEQPITKKSFLVDSPKKKITEVITLNSLKEHIQFKENDTEDESDNKNLNYEYEYDSSKRENSMPKFINTELKKQLYLQNNTNKGKKSYLKDNHTDTKPHASNSFEKEESEAAFKYYESLQQDMLNNPDTSRYAITSEIKPQAKHPEPIRPVSDMLLADNQEYVFPSIELLNKSQPVNAVNARAQILENSRKLEDTLRSFGVEAKVVEVSKGPTVTRYEISPGPGVKVSKIAGLADDLALSLAATGIRIEAPIPGKAAVGIEMPNKEVTPVLIRDVIEGDIFKKFPSKLAFALGKDIAGNPVIADIAKMPHLLIAGATGSGKSVCINTLITSILYNSKPDEVKLLMIDPKVVELSIYNGIPHLLVPVVTDPKKAAGVLNWAVQEMIRRYNDFAENSVRDLKGYNKIIAEQNGALLPQIVIIIDELADLMMAAPNEVEDSICRLAQMARAAGLHLIIATQRPSVDVITGLIKANIPSRLAFSVSSGTDSRTILDSVGAEKLLGKGDMLFYPVGMAKPQRVQGAFVSDKEVESVVNFVKKNKLTYYDPEIVDKITAPKMSADLEELFEDVVRFVIEKEKASALMIQRQFKIGYSKASRLIEELEACGVIGADDGSKSRKVLMTYSQWNEHRNPLD